MPDTHRALAWLQRRAAGESAESIADHDGVPVDAIHRATDQLLRAHHARQREQRAHDWAALRNAGQRVIDIAEAYGVTRHLVGTETAHLGPFPKPSPTPDQITEWVIARHQGTSITEIARTANVSLKTVTDATRAHGPYPRKAPRSSTPAGHLTKADIARLLGISNPTILDWERRGYLPPPDTETRRLWRETTITTWLPTSDLQRCPSCGTWTRHLGRHQRLQHGRES